MIKEEMISLLHHRMAQACPKCVKKVFSLLMDPQTQGLFAPWVKERKGLIQFHVHAAGPLDNKTGEEAIMFLMAVYITAEQPILYFTPSSRTVEGAFENLKETIARESKRLSRQTTSRVHESPRRAGERDPTSEADVNPGAEGGVGEENQRSTG
jgi:hypothetical protein